MLYFDDVPFGIGHILKGQQAHPGHLSLYKVTHCRTTVGDNIIRHGGHIIHGKGDVRKTGCAGFGGGDFFKRVILKYLECWAILPMSWEQKVHAGDMRLFKAGGLVKPFAG